MGMFTTIRDEDGFDVQIKCGWGYDFCETYLVGETVPWRIDKFNVGKGYMLDDVYLGTSCKMTDWWVVVKNHVVLVMFPYVEGHTQEALCEQFKIQFPPEDLWSEKAHARKRAADARAAAFQESLEGLTKEALIAKYAEQYRKNNPFRRLFRIMLQAELDKVPNLLEACKRQPMSPKTHPIEAPIGELSDRDPKTSTCLKPLVVITQVGLEEGFHPPGAKTYTREARTTVTDPVLLQLLEAEHSDISMGYHVKEPEPCAMCETPEDVKDADAD